MKKYVKVMFGLKSGADGFDYKENEVNVANNWNSKENHPSKIGGFNFSTKDKILRYLVRGDIIYDVILPEDAEVVDWPNEQCPHGIFLTNKIIINNPRQVNDDLAMELYKKSDLPEKSYFKSFAGCAIRGNVNTAKQIIIDKVNVNNIDTAIEEFEDFTRPSHYWDKQSDEKAITEIKTILENIKNQK